jgi:hypothetical protein
MKDKVFSSSPYGRMKDLTLSAGRRSRELRLDGVEDPDLGMHDLYVFELWKRVVERFSTTKLSHPEDKLMALAGIARHFQRHLFSGRIESKYVAGMWSRNLESQLLWQVNEDYRDGIFDNPARRDASRAPSFSWASIDTPYGITYGDVTDYGEEDAAVQRPVGDSDGEISAPLAELLFRVLDHDITRSDSQNDFGMVDSGGMLLLRPRFLRPIKLNRLEPPQRVPYSWYLADAEDPAEHSNLYLDAPESDIDIFRADAELFVMPAAYGERTAHEMDRYLFCLLLKLEQKDAVAPEAFEKLSGTGVLSRYRRIGITKLSNYEDVDEQTELMAVGASEDVCLV